MFDRAPERDHVGGSTAPGRSSVNAVLLAAGCCCLSSSSHASSRRATWDVVLLSAVAIAAIAVLVVPDPPRHQGRRGVPRGGGRADGREHLAPRHRRRRPTTDRAAPVKVSTGELRGIGHDATGTASIYRQPNGTAVVALEDIDIEPGPDYRVIVVRGTDRESAGRRPRARRAPREPGHAVLRGPVGYRSRCRMDGAHLVPGVRRARSPTPVNRPSEQSPVRRRTDSAAVRAHGASVGDHREHQRGDQAGGHERGRSRPRDHAERLADLRSRRR